MTTTDQLQATLSQYGLILGINKANAYTEAEEDWHPKDMKERVRTGTHNTTDTKFRQVAIINISLKIDLDKPPQEQYGEKYVNELADYRTMEQNIRLAIKEDAPEYAHLGSPALIIRKLAEQLRTARAFQAANEALK